MVVVDDRTALAKIQAILSQDRATNWTMPDEFAYKYAHNLSSLAPRKALDQAAQFIDEVRQHNQAEEKKFQKAEVTKQKLTQGPISNAGPRGVRGYFQRQLLALLNGTANSLDRIEVTEKGMFVYQPFATVSQRTVKHKDIADKKVLLSVNPPGYLDGLLGFMRQFRKTVAVPWGEVVLYEPGSGKDIASAISFRPDKKVKEITGALADLHRVENPYEKYKRLPRLVDLLIYYDIEKWDQIVASPSYQAQP